MRSLLLLTILVTAAVAVEPDKVADDLKPGQDLPYCAVCYKSGDKMAWIYGWWNPQIEHIVPGDPKEMLAQTNLHGCVVKVVPAQAPGKMPTSARDTARRDIIAHNKQYAEDHAHGQATP
jgi:hypothetical protein